MGSASSLQDPNTKPSSNKYKPSTLKSRTSMRSRRPLKNANTLKSTSKKVQWEFETSKTNKPPNVSPKSIDIQNSNLKRIIIELVKNEDIGFSVRGGAEHGIGIYISCVERNSVAERSGLQAGDQIISINGHSFIRVFHRKAAEVIKSSQRLDMQIRRAGRIPGAYETHQTYEWTDARGRPVSPPPEVDYLNRYDPSSLRKSALMICKQSDERKVHLIVDDTRALGLSIRGGSEVGLGIYISGLQPGSTSAQAELQVGDQILDVNGQSFLDITHRVAARMLRSSRHLMLTVKDVGKVPYSRATHDVTNWIKSEEIVRNPGSASTSSGGSPVATIKRKSKQTKFVKGAGSQMMLTTALSGHKTHLSLVNEAARKLLNQEERQLLNYYLHSYTSGQIIVDALANGLLEILDSDRKVALLEDIRGILKPNDIESFDDIAYQTYRFNSNVYHGSSSSQYSLGSSDRGSREHRLHHKRLAREERLNSLNVVTAEIHHEPSQSLASNVGSCGVHSPSEDSGVDTRGMYRSSDSANVLYNRNVTSQPKANHQNEPIEWSKGISTDIGGQNGRKSVYGYHRDETKNGILPRINNRMIGKRNHNPKETAQGEMLAHDISDDFNEIQSLTISHDTKSNRKTSRKNVYPSTPRFKRAQVKYALSEDSTKASKTVHTQSPPGPKSRYAFKRSNGNEMAHENHRHIRADINPRFQNQHKINHFTNGGKGYNQFHKIDQNKLFRNETSDNYEEPLSVYEELPGVDTESISPESRTASCPNCRTQQQVSKQQQNSHKFGIDYRHSSLGNPNSLNDFSKKGDCYVRNSSDNFQNFRQPRYIPNDRHKPGNVSSRFKVSNYYKYGLDKQHFAMESDSESDKIQLRLFENCHNPRRDNFGDKHKTQNERLPELQTISLSPSNIEDIDLDFYSHELNGLFCNKETNVATNKSRLVHVPKVRPKLGLSIEGGADTGQKIPRIIKIQRNGCAALTDLQLYDELLEVNHVTLLGLTHAQVAQRIAEAFRNPESQSIALLVQP